jgi:hypothetical protein
MWNSGKLESEALRLGGLARKTDRNRSHAKPRRRKERQGAGDKEQGTRCKVQGAGTRQVIYPQLATSGTGFLISTFGLRDVEGGKAGIGNFAALRLGVREGLDSASTRYPLLAARYFPSGLTQSRQGAKIGRVQGTRDKEQAAVIYSLLTKTGAQRPPRSPSGATASPAPCSLSLSFFAAFAFDSLLPPWLRLCRARSSASQCSLRPPAGAASGGLPTRRRLKLSGPLPA